MNVAEVAAFAARVADTLAEAEEQLAADEYERVLELVATALARRVSDRIEQRWMGR